MLRKEIKKKNLIQILGLESLSPEAQVEVVDSAVNVIEMRCLNEVLESLDGAGEEAVCEVDGWWRCGGGWCFLERQ